MADLVGVGVILATLALLVGALTGRVSVRSCCRTPPPRDDLRLRDAGHEEPAPARPEIGSNPR